MKSDHYARVLTDVTAAGLYRAPPRGREAILAAARKCAFASLPVDLNLARNKDSLLDALAAALRFPDWFGQNWDALDDCLADLSWLPAVGYVVLLERGEGLRSADPQSYSAALAIFADASRAWGERGVPFWTLVETPDGGLPLFPPGRR